MEPVQISTDCLQWTWHLGSPVARDQLVAAEELAYSLLTEARKAAENAYAPYSKFRVGAALSSDLSGKEIFCGCNIENASYGATMCAERVAMFSAIAAGRTEIKMLALTTLDSAAEPDLSKRSPCGLCRQVMSEFLDSEALILIDGGNTVDGIARIDVASIDTVLPWRFKL